MDDEAAKRSAAIEAYRQKLLQHSDMDSRVRHRQFAYATKHAFVDAIAWQLLCLNIMAGSVGVHLGRGVDILQLEVLRSSLNVWEINWLCL